MKDLILAIRDYLRDTYHSDYIDPANIYLAIDLGLIPMDAGFPCIGIKDGPLEYSSLSTYEQEKSMKVSFAVYMQISKEAETIEGTGTAIADGILAITDHLRDALTDNHLGLTGMESAVPESETESELVGSDFLAMRKILTMRYVQVEQLT